MNFSAGTYFKERTGGEFDRKIGIYVEGRDDAHFVDKILLEVGADEESVRLVHSGGKDEMRRSLISVVKSRAYVTREVETIAIIHDCDEDPEKAIRDINSALRSAGLPSLAHDNIVEYDDGRRIGLFMIPSGADVGAVEDLLLSTLGEDERFAVLEEAFSEIERRFGPLTKRAKRLVQIYLAAKDPLRKGAGLALKEGHFPVDHANLVPLKDFLTRLTA